ncbi:hypothetical protein FRC01_006585 [Tulasnella sp. 417]|nr:hypothetical protein FRC01_006585 [Tulasnella sp. 417]
MATGISDAIRTTPAALSAEDEVDGVYHSTLARLIDDFRAQIKRGLPFDLTHENLLSILDALITSKFAGGLDDRLFLLEHALTFLSRYPPNSHTSKELQDKVISLLWYDLAHPPASLVGSKYQFRTANGSSTSIWHPEMGMRSNAPPSASKPTPFTRASIRYAFEARGVPKNVPKDKPENYFDHPAGLSTFFFAFANLVIHSLFWTTFENEDRTQPINKVSSYLDLSPLYGSSEEELSRLRLNDGTGRIHPDTFADHRVLMMPPSTPALLVMFSRNHNYIVQKLLDVNERAQWKNPPPQDKVAKQKQDDEIFGTARLINCGWFMSTIFGDYLASILGLVREGNSWSLDPLSNFRAASHEIVERGTGNIVSVEFLALYHFHSSIGVKDEKWVENEFAELLGTRDWDSIDMGTFRRVMKERADNKDLPPHTPPTTWTFGGCKRSTKDGTFKDDDLAKILLDATEAPANAFKARGTPHVMKLYRHPDNLELYVGLQAEQSKKVMPGAGLCPGYTMSRAILADAVALVRGDRFLTNDFTAYNLTAWGMQDCTRDPKNSANGGMMGKLLSRCLPNHFPADSSYTNFPFVVPKKMQGFLSAPGVGTAHLYNFNRPQAIRPAFPVTKYHDVISALRAPGLASTVPANAEIVLAGKGYLATYNDAAANAKDKKLIAEAFIPNPVVSKKHVDYLQRTTELLLKEKRYSLVGHDKQCINIVRDVLNILPIYFVSEHVLGLPLKTSVNPHGSALDQEVYIKFKEIYEFIFIDLAEPSTQVAKEHTVKGFSQYFQDTVLGNIQSIASEQIPLLGLGASAIHWATQTPHEASKWLKRLLENGKGKTKEELANDAMALAIALRVASGDLKITHSDGQSVSKGVDDRVYLSFTEAGVDPSVWGQSGTQLQALFAGEIVKLLGPDWLRDAIVPVVKTIFKLKDLKRAPGNSGKLLSFNEMIEGTPVTTYLNYKQEPTFWSSDLTVTFTS